MSVLRMDHVGIIVADLDSAVAFFVALGFSASPIMSIDSEWAGRVNGLPHSHVEMVMVRTPDHRHQVEITRFLAPADAGRPERVASNRLGIRHIALVVDDVDASVAAVRGAGRELIGEIVDYEGTWRLCYLPARRASSWSLHK